MADDESSSSEDEEILLLLLLLRRRRRCLRAANRKTWVKQWILRRQAQGACANIVCELNCEDPEKFRQYHRLDKCLFEEVLALVSPVIAKKDTHLRCSLKPIERLSVTLRFLATGLCYMLPIIISLLL
jgi:hypothetical protein